jgi:CubicO group peptidase (beta-lactamase class C family)
MKKRYIAIIMIAFLPIAAMFFGSTTHSNLKGTDAEKLQTFMYKKAKDINFNGTVLVAKDGEVLFSKGYGYADQEKKIENKTDTVFHIASLSKPFTAVSILQLEEKGKLSTEDRLSKYFPDFPRGDEITIHQLLNHSSGIPELLKLVEHSNKYTTNEMVDVIKKAELEFKPGSKFSYSNSNYLLLALIIEKGSGLKISDYIEENIFIPAKMKHSFSDISPVESAIGYEKMSFPSHFIDISLAYGSGNLLSTSEDLLLFDGAIKDGTLLGEEQIRKMEEGYINTAPFGIVKYGYGWNVSTSWYSFNHKAIAHSGGYPGFKNFLLRFPEDDITIIILSNNTGEWNAGGLSLELASIVLKKRFWYFINKL